MTKISFYILNHEENILLEQNILWQFASRLCKKAVLTGKVSLLCDTEDLTNLSEYLWSFSAVDFLAHSVNDIESHINITDTMPEQADIIINLTEQTVLNKSSSRIIEIITSNESSKQAGRKRYKTYKDNGFILESHQIPISVAK